MNIFETGEKKFIKKGALLLQQGEICKFGCKVISGCLKSYVLDDTGKEHIMQFRYIDFIQTYPTLTQRLPLKLIAAYIGITPEYLSEIRRKFAGKRIS